MSGDNANAAHVSGAAPIMGGADPLAALFQQAAANDPQPAPNLSGLIAQQQQQAAAQADSFNPSIHETVNGAPVRNLDGTYRLKRGRGSPSFKARQASADAPAAPPDVTLPPAPAQEPPPPPALPYGPDEAKRDAVLAVGTLTASLQAFLGPKWAAESEERDRMESELAAYCLAHGGLGIPPWLGVAMAFGMYAGRRIELPGGMLGRFGVGSLAGPDEPLDVERIEPPDLAPPPIQQQPATGAAPRPVSQPGNGTATAGTRPPVRTAA